jgi:hypothetical protein
MMKLMKKSKNNQTVTAPCKEELAIHNLRLQKQKHEKTMRESGAAAGREYVLNVGEDDGVYEEMLSLARQEQTAHHGVGDLAALTQALDCDPSDWLDIHGDQAEDEEWVFGFVQGALEKFTELRRKL